MYRVESAKKTDARLRWGLPDRVFFACGACHILAYAFLRKFRPVSAGAVWLRPHAGFTGNHIVVDGGDWVFDYHGYSARTRFLDHTFGKAARWWPGWQAELMALPTEVLISEAGSRTYPGLWLREPQQFLHDALPRAEAYLRRFPPPELWAAVSRAHPR